MKKGSLRYEKVQSLKPPSDKGKRIANKPSSGRKSANRLRSFANIDYFRAVYIRRVTKGARESALKIAFTLTKPTSGSLCLLCKDRHALRKMRKKGLSFSVVPLRTLRSDINPPGDLRYTRAA